LWIYNTGEKRKQEVKGGGREKRRKREGEGKRKKMNGSVTLT